MLMRYVLRSLMFMLLALQAPLAQSAGSCVPVRVGYIDQHRPPYWLGEGELVPEPAGASVDLIRAAVMGSGFNCPPTLVRLPAGRLKLALEAGDIDMTPIGEQASYAAEIALPRDRDGNVDRNRAMPSTVVVLVRAKDRVPRCQPARILPWQDVRGLAGQWLQPALTRNGLDHRRRCA